MSYFTTNDTRKATVAKGSRSGSKNTDISSPSRGEGNVVDLYKVNSAFNNSMKRYVKSNKQ